MMVMMELTVQQIIKMDGWKAAKTRKILCMSFRKGISLSNFGGINVKFLLIGEKKERKNFGRKTSHQIAYYRARTRLQHSVIDCTSA